MFCNSSLHDMHMKGRAPGLPPEYPDCSRIFTEHGAHSNVGGVTVCAAPLRYIHCKQSAWYRGLKLLRAKMLNVRLARSGCNSAPWLDFGNVLRYCVMYH